MREGEREGQYKHIQGTGIAYKKKSKPILQKFMKSYYMTEHAWTLSSLKTDTKLSSAALDAGKACTTLRT